MTNALISDAFTFDTSVLMDEYSPRSIGTSKLVWCFAVSFALILNLALAYLAYTIYSGPLGQKSRRFNITTPSNVNFNQGHTLNIKLEHPPNKEQRNHSAQFNSELKPAESSSLPPSAVPVKSTPHTNAPRNIKPQPPQIKPHSSTQTFLLRDALNNLAKTPSEKPTLFIESHEMANKSEKEGSLIANVFDPKLKDKIRSLRPTTTRKAVFMQSFTKGTGDTLHRMGDSCFLDQTIMTERGPHQVLYMTKCPPQ